MYKYVYHLWKKNMSSPPSSSRILPFILSFCLLLLKIFLYTTLHCASKVRWSRCDCGGRRSCLRRRRWCGCWWRYVHAYCYIGSWNTQIPSVTDPIFDVPCTTEHSRAHLLASDEAWIKIHERCAFGKSKHVIFVHSGWDNAAAMAPPSLLWAAG